MAYDKQYYESRQKDLEKDIQDLIIEAFNDFMAVAIKTSQKQQKLAQKRQELQRQQAESQKVGKKNETKN